MKLQSAIDRLKEPSTYAGIAALLALFGKHVDADKYQAAVAAGTAVAASLSVFMSEKK